MANKIPIKTLIRPIPAPGRQGDELADRCRLVHGDAGTFFMRLFMVT
jgi:hypothetical protein